MRASPPLSPCLPSGTRSAVRAKALALVLLLFVSACGDGPGEESVSPEFANLRLGEETPGEYPAVVFTDVTASAGITFTHVTGAFGKKYLPETMGSGVAFLDYDGDGWPDLLFVNSAHWPGREEEPAPTAALYRNLGNGRFADATAGSGLDVALYGMGVTAADYDGDGDVDVYITAAGDNRLFRNDGGRFTDVTAAAGVAGGSFADDEGRVRPEWSSGATFLDADGDGDLDLFVANYVKWSIETDVFTTMNGKTKAYTTPAVYSGLRPRLFENAGDGTFADVSDRVTLAADADPKSLGVLVTDFDRDGLPDLFVTNDTQPNYLLRNQGGGRFLDVALEVGVAFDETGEARAGMGAATTVLANGRIALAVGNFSRESVAYYTRFPSGVFVDRAAPAGLGASTQPALTFGLAFLDYDLDGRIDLLMANGHIEPTIQEVQREVPFAQPPQLFRGVSRRYTEVSEHVGTDFPAPMVARGLAVADYDRDGDADLVFSVNGGPARLLRNDGATGHAWLRVRLRQGGKNPDAVGAIVAVTGGGREQVSEVRAGGSYLSQHELPRTFGLGKLDAAEQVVVRWPDGTTESFQNVPARQEVLITRGEGLTPVKR